MSTMDDDWDVITLTDDTTWFERIDAINRERQDDMEADPQGASEVCHFLEKHLREHGVLDSEERYEAVAEFLLGGGTIDVALVATLASSPCWRASVCKRCGNYLATKSAAMDEEMLTCLEACLAEMEHLPLEDVSSEIQLVYDSRPLDRAVLEDVVSKLRLAYPDLCPGMSKGEETVALENGKVVKWQKRLERPPALPTQRKRLNQELEDQAVEDVHIALKVYEMHKDLQWLVKPELCHYCSSFCESRCNLCFSTCRELERAKQHKMKATIKECLGMLAQHHHTLAALWTTRNEEELPWLRWNGSDSHHPDPIADPKLRVDYMHTLQKHFRGSAVSLKDYNTVSFRKSREQRQADIEEWDDTDEPGETHHIPSFPSSEVGLQRLSRDSDEGPRMPRLPFASRLAASDATPGAMANLGIFSTTVLEVDTSDIKVPRASPRNLMEQIAFDIEDVSKCFAAHVEDSPKIEEGSDLPILESPRTLCGGGGCLATRVQTGLEPGDINPYDAEWLKAKREEDEEYVLYLKSLSPDGIPLVKL